MKCSFCGKEMEKGTGTVYVTDVGKIFNFCSSRCEKNQLKLKRNPKKIEWVIKKKKD